MRRLVFALALFIAPAVIAQTADIGIVSFTSTRTSVTTGERFVLAMKWHNYGPDTATSITATMGGADLFAVQGAGTDNWPCVPSDYGHTFTCRGASLAPGGEAEMIATFLAPPNSASGATFTANGSVHAENADPATSNNAAQLSIGLTAATEHADLSMTLPAPSYTVARGASFTIPVTVTNGGTADAHQLMAWFQAPEGESIRLTAHGDGWNCSNLTHSAQLLACLSNVLTSGSQSVISLDVTAPDHDLSFPIEARVRAENGFDPVSSNNLTLTRVDAGTAGVWSRVLIPLMPSETPGANGSLWRTQTMMLVRNPVPIEIEPDACDYNEVICHTLPAIVPVQTQVDISKYVPVGAGPQDRGGAFIYVREGDDSKLAFNSRVWDVARQAQTAGSEIPVARESDFTTGTISLLGIPVAPEYRQTLRVYDFDGRNGARVRIDLYANDETTPRASVEEALAVSPFAHTTTDASLPTHPAYLQIDPATLASLAGITSLRIDITPLDEGMRIWSFASITNNDTHHVTTFSAQ